MTWSTTTRLRLALVGAGKTFGGLADGRNVALVKIAHFGAISKPHAVAKPIETIRQDDLALCSGNNAIKINRCHDLVAIAQVDLALMRVSKSVGLPKSLGSIIA